MILVTGGCGYIGSHVVKALSEAGEKVIVFDNLSSGQKTNLLHQEKLVIGDVTNPDDLKTVFDNYSIDLVIHCAALVNAAESVTNPQLYKKVNDEGSSSLWQIATKAGVEHFIYASSAAVYGIPQTTNRIQETAQLKPTNPYGETKLAGERSLIKLSSQTNSNYAILRFFNVGGAEPLGRIGQSLDSLAVTQVLFSVAAGKKTSITINGHDFDTPDGTVIRDFVHVTDISKAIVKAVKYLKANQSSFTANLGSGQPSSLNQLIDTVRQVTGKDILVKYGPRKQGDISYSLASITKVKKVLDWQPQLTLLDIIQDAWNYYDKN